MNILRCLLPAAMMLFVIAGCGTEDTLSGTPDDVPVEGPAPDGPVAGSIVLDTGGVIQINSGTGDTISLTATVKDSNNVLLEGAVVTLSSPAADNADLAQLTKITNSSGTILGSVGSRDQTNRTITVTASVDSVNAAGATITLTDSVTIIVAGTDISICCTNNLAYGQVATLTVSLTDSLGIGIGGVDIALSSSDAANVVSPTTVTTDSNGKAAITLTAGITGSISASALGATTDFSITVSSDSFVINVAPEIIIATCEPITATWTSSGVGVSGQPVTFSTSRGSLFTDATCASTGTSAITDASGVATIYASSSQVGIVTVEADASAVGGAQTTGNFEFIATVPASMILTADQRDIPIGGVANLTAKIFDSNNNPVKNAQISFTIVAGTPGDNIDPGDITDSYGNAYTVYTASSTPSSADGVIIEAVVKDNPSIKQTITLTVTGATQSMSVNMANTVILETSASYAHEGTIIVNDSGGNPVEGATIDIKLIPLAYDKGIRIMDTVTKVWEATSSITGGPLTHSCISEDMYTGIPQYDLNGSNDSEDLNDNGVLDAGEDLNGNGTLDIEDYNGDGNLTPGGVGNVDTNLVTNINGIATFQMHYLKNLGSWTKVRLIITMRVSGTESVKYHDQVYLVAAEEIKGDTDAGIVGLESPYGTLGNTCSDPS